jgi:hypothetical protein
MLGIFWVSSLPGQSTPEDSSVNIVFYLIPPTLQNLLHVPVFGVLAWLWYWSLQGWLPRDAPLSAIAFLLAAGYGVADEFHQLMVPGRYASLTDIVLNALGAAIALWLVRLKKAGGHHA